MFLLEPNPTPYDLRFRLLGIPVRVHPMFWAITLLMGRNSSPKGAVIWVAAVFLSILVHEFGHALTIRTLGSRPWVVLWALGGLAISQPVRRDPRKEIMILLAGPGAGFLLAGIVLAGVALSGHHFQFRFGWPWLLEFETDVESYAGFFVHQMLFINIWWGIVNLLPIMPLDGGQICRELLTLFRRYNPILEAAQISVVCAILVSAFAIVILKDWYLAMMFGYLAYNNFAVLQMYGGGGGRWQ